MDFDMLFSIGELAKLCKVTPKTLRFYDKLGLLKPAMVNPQNGYRFYTRWHITRVTAIRQLQDLGVTLDDIHSFFEENNNADTVECLSALLEIQRNAIDRKMIELSKKQKAIKALQLQCEKIKGKIDYIDMQGIIIRSIPKRKILYIAYYGEYKSVLFRKAYQEILSSIKSEGYNMEDMELYGPLAIFETPRNVADGQKAGIKFGYETNTQQELPFHTLYINEALYACYIYKGPYACLKAELCHKLYEDIKTMGYQILAPQIEYYYINEAMVNKDDNYLTEIQIPIKVIDN